MLDALVDLVLPRRCVGCGRPSIALCDECVPRLAPRPVPVAGVLTIAAAVYGGEVRAALLAYKERGRRDLAQALGVRLADAVRAVAHGCAGRAVLVSVPSARAVAAARGGDHVQRLARVAAVELGARVAPRGLVHARIVADSAGLDSAARTANLAGALRARPPTGIRARTGPGSPPDAVVVVDDIVTTGSTLREATRALRAAGWPVVGAAVIAATPLRHPRSGG